MVDFVNVHHCYFQSSYASAKKPIKRRSLCFFAQLTDSSFCFLLGRPQPFVTGIQRT